MSLPETVTDKSGRILALREVGPDEMFDLIEAAGDAASGGAASAWLSYATVVCTVREIDGVPEPFPTKKGQLKALAKKLGNIGIVAVEAAMNPKRDDDDGASEVVTAKLSRHPTFREMMFLLKSGVPYEVYTRWSAARRAAAVVALREMDGLRYDWNAGQYVVME